MDGMDENIKGPRADHMAMKFDLSTVKIDVTSVKFDVTSVKADVHNLLERQVTLEAGHGIKA